MIRVQLDDLTVCVDEETAELLNDSDYAAKYLAMVRHAIAGRSSQPVEEADCQQSELAISGRLPQPVEQVDSQQYKQFQTASGNSSEANPSCIWKSSHPTEDDNKATLTLLSLRKSMDSQFNDKKTHKNELWKRIAGKMNEMGFYVGSGIEGREKVRQKFANLHAKYIKYCDSRKTTGQGKLKVPRFYEEMEEILGDKHKVNPIINIDSLKVNKPTKNMECSSMKEAETRSPCTSTSILNDSATSSPINVNSSTLTETPSSSNQFQNNRFTKLTSRSRPRSNQQNCLQELVNIQKQNQTNRKEEFKTMMEFFQSTNNLRHEQIMALINRGQKRKNSNESDSE